jgi:hypothetical protein
MDMDLSAASDGLGPISIVRSGCTALNLALGCPTEGDMTELLTSKFIGEIMAEADTYTNPTWLP